MRRRKTNPPLLLQHSSLRPQHLALPPPPRKTNPPPPYFLNSHKMCRNSGTISLVIANSTAFVDPGIAKTGFPRQIPPTARESIAPAPICSHDNIRNNSP